MNLGNLQSGIFMCPKCLTVTDFLHHDFTIMSDDGYKYIKIGKCSKCGSDEMFSVDEEMVNILYWLNKKGYRTDFHCAGHQDYRTNKPEYSDCYISFKSMDFIPFPEKAFPKGWQLARHGDNLYNNDYDGLIMYQVDARSIHVLDGFDRNQALKNLHNAVATMTKYSTPLLLIDKLKRQKAAKKSFLSTMALIFMCDLEKDYSSGLYEPYNILCAMDREGYNRQLTLNINLDKDNSIRKNIISFYYATDHSQVYDRNTPQFVLEVGVFNEMKPTKFIFTKESTADHLISIMSTIFDYALRYIDIKNMRIVTREDTLISEK